MATDALTWSLETEQAALEELRGSFNWGRWGADDEVGTLHLVTPDVIQASASLVQRGQVIALGERFGRGARPQGILTPTHFMMGADNSQMFGDPTIVAYDGLVLTSTHGTTTHVDALCHVSSYKDAFYNDTPAAAVTFRGAERLDIAKLPGLVTRGVLLDIARLRGVTALERHDLITATDLEAAAAQAGVDPGPGDAVLLRTGWPNAFTGDPGAWFSPTPGIGPSAALWLTQRDVTLIGSDQGGVEAVNIQADKSDDPRANIIQTLHPLLIGNMGVYLLELLNLEELAAADAHTFQFVLAPLRLVGGTGSPVNPLAIF